MYDLDTPVILPADEARFSPAFARPSMVALLALACGFAVDTLAVHHPPGWGLAMALALGVVLGASIGPLLGNPAPAATYPLVAGGLLIAGFVAVRTSPVLLSLNIGAVVVVVAVLAQLHKAGGPHRWTITDYGRHPFTTLGDMAVGGSRFVSADLREAFGEVQGSRLRPIAVGLVIGAPLVMIFAGLFASADAEFGDLLDGLINGVVFGSLHWRSTFAILIALAIAGLWRTNRIPIEMSPPRQIRQRLDPATGITVLALLVGLFLFFVMTQVLGHDPPLARNRDYSANARRGFFQLVTVAFLVLNVLLWFDWLTRRKDGKRSPAFDRLAVVLIALTGIVMVSAFDRMRLYVDEFGLTELRFYTTAFMFWVAFVLVWFMGTVLTNRRGAFAAGLIASALVFIVGLNLANPDAFIVRFNWDRHLAGEGFSDRYNSELSVDALPTLVAIRRSAGPGEWCFIELRLAEAGADLERYWIQHGFLSDSVAAQRARRALDEIEPIAAADLDCAARRLTAGDSSR